MLVRKIFDPVQEIRPNIGGWALFYETTVLQNKCVVCISYLLNLHLGGRAGLVNKCLASTRPLGVGVSWFLRVSGSSWHVLCTYLKLGVYWGSLSKPHTSELNGEFFIIIYLLEGNHDRH